MNDLEHQRQFPAFTRDLYLELQRIEERGIRLKQARRRRFAAFFGLGRKSIVGTARTA